MIALGLVALLATPPRLQEPAAPQAIQTYQEPALNLAFDYPKSWKTVRKGKESVIITMPIDNTTNTAELEVARTPFHSSKSIWQTIQVRINEQLKRDIKNQWEEDVLSVPMLLTQVNYQVRGTDYTTLSGLYYTRTPQKLHFRLTAPTGDFPQAKYQFDQTLLSVRTIDNSELLADDENVVFETPNKKAPPVAKPTVSAPPRRKVLTESSNSKSPKASVRVPLTVSTKEVALMLPEGWKGELGEDGRITVSHPELSGPIQMEVRSTLDSEPPLNALFKLSSASLADFTSITKRTDTSDQPNSAKCVITTVWRIGKRTDGDLMVHEVVGVQGNFYFLASYRLTNPALLENEKKLLRRLLDVIDLEAAP